MSMKGHQNDRRSPTKACSLLTWGRTVGIYDEKQNKTMQS